MQNNRSIYRDHQVITRRARFSICINSSNGKAESWQKDAMIY